MSAELIGILSVGATVLASNIAVGLWLSGWLRDMDRRLARLEGRIGSQLLSIEEHLRKSPAPALPLR